MKGGLLSELYHRTKAAERLGYDVQLVATEDGNLRVLYKEKIPCTPYSWEMFEE